MPLRHPRLRRVDITNSSRTVAINAVGDVHEVTSITRVPTAASKGARIVATPRTEGFPGFRSRPIGREGVENRASLRPLTPSAPSLPHIGPDSVLGVFPEVFAGGPG